MPSGQHSPSSPFSWGCLPPVFYYVFRCYVRGLLPSPKVKLIDTVTQELHKKKKASQSCRLRGLVSCGAQRQNRTADTRIFSPLLYRLSYLGGRRICNQMRTLCQEKSCSGFFPCFPMCFLLPRKTTKYHEGGIVMKSQSWLFSGFYFWFGSFFGLPDRGEVC